MSVGKSLVEMSWMSKEKRCCRAGGNDLREGECDRPLQCRGSSRRGVSVVGLCVNGEVEGHQLRLREAGHWE